MKLGRNKYFKEATVSRSGVSLHFHKDFLWIRYEKYEGDIVIPRSEKPIIRGIYEKQKPENPHEPQQEDLYVVTIENIKIKCKDKSLFELLLDYFYKKVKEETESDKEENRLLVTLRDIVFDFVEQSYGVKYNYSAIERRALNSLIKSLKMVVNKEDKTDKEWEQEIVDTFTALLVGVKKMSTQKRYKIFENNMNLAYLEKNFNDIFGYLQKNNANGQTTAKATVESFINS